VDSSKAWILKTYGRMRNADAIVYATALEEECKVVTSDSHFKGLDKVVFV
jgi:predicted nucleic acid-binding protein